MRGQAMTGKLKDRLDAWASLKCEIGDLRKARRALVCDDPCVERHDAAPFLDMPATESRIACREHAWPRYTRYSYTYDEEVEEGPMSPEDAAEYTQDCEWCPSCVEWLRLLIEERKLRKRVGGLTSALLRQWRREEE
jgi:hypothetical protein